MQFKKLMADKIMAGEKTATRRLKKPRFKVGSRQPVQNGYRDKARCYIVIDVIYEQRMDAMTDADVRREGFDNYYTFYAYICKVNKTVILTIRPVWVIEFHKEADNGTK